MENLSVLVPELLDKLKVVEEKKPVNNVSSNIMRIRELISQARSVAKKVSVHLTSSSLTFYCVCVCVFRLITGFWIVAHFYFKNNLINSRRWENDIVYIYCVYIHCMYGIFAWKSTSDVFSFEKCVCWLNVFWSVARSRSKCQWNSTGDPQLKFILQAT